MSDDVFYPTDFAGLTWDIKKTPIFNTKIQTSVNFAELRASFAGSPVYEMSMTFSMLRGLDRTDIADTNQYPESEVATLMGFYASRLGRWDSWLLYEPNDNTIPVAAPQIFGVGDGGISVFQLTRTLGSWFTERVAAPADGSVRIWIDGIEKFNPTHWTGGTLATKGVVTFVTPPGAGLYLTWSGSYYFRCRFTEDQMEFNQFMYQLWETQEIKFLASLGTKI